MESSKYRAYLLGYLLEGTVENGSNFGKFELQGLFAWLFFLKGSQKIVHIMESSNYSGYFLGYLLEGNVENRLNYGKFKIQGLFAWLFAWLFA